MSSAIRLVQLGWPSSAAFDDLLARLSSGRSQGEARLLDPLCSAAIDHKRLRPSATHRCGSRSSDLPVGQMFHVDRHSDDERCCIQRVLQGDRCLKDEVKSRDALLQVRRESSAALYESVAVESFHQATHIVGPSSPENATPARVDIEALNHTPPSLGWKAKLPYSADTAGIVTGDKKPKHIGRHALTRSRGVFAQPGVEEPTQVCGDWIDCGAGSLRALGDPLLDQAIDRLDADEGGARSRNSDSGKRGEQLLCVIGHDPIAAVRLQQCRPTVTSKHDAVGSGRSDNDGHLSSFSWRGC
jgi:hypothetical protein